MSRTPHTPHTRIRFRSNVSGAGRGSRSSWPWRLTLAAALRASRRERGTVLLMVVGVLALLAIIGVVYATIGRGDRMAATSTQRVARLDDQVAQISQYLAGVVGDSTFAQYTEPTAQTGASSVARPRGYTYPWTNPYELSVNPADYANTGITQQLMDPTGTTRAPTTYGFAKFQPTGDNTTAWPNAQRNQLADPREYGDSYLATLEPEWLRLQTAGNVARSATLADLRDWRHISNFAPSGNFVNLANLRKKNNGGFNAAPGFKPGTPAAVAQMSYGLTLFNPADANLRSYPGPLTTPNQRVPGPAASLVANPAIPAHWTNNQVGAFRPNVPDDTNSSGVAIGPADYEYLSNQWADADGDGFIDSRWFELTDISGLFNLLGPASKAIVPSNGRPRLFLAVRCIDNSAKVDVNTAGDFKAGPFPMRDYGTTLPIAPSPGYTRDSVNPPGATPADIDVSRLLAMYDISTTLRQAGAPKLGYDGLPAPSASDPDGQETDYRGYAGYAGVTTPLTASQIVGRAAYANLHDTLTRGVTNLGNVVTNEYIPYAPERQRNYDLFGFGPTSTRLASVNVPGGTAMQGAIRSPFDMSDELDLAAFFGVNDSDTMSRLEASIGGRSTTASQATFSPLRDNRPRSLEMRYRDEFAGDIFQNLGTSTTTKQAALLAVFSDVRHLLTTVNGSRPIKDGSVAPDDHEPLFSSTSPSAPPYRDTQPASTDITHALQVIQDLGQKNLQDNTFRTPAKFAQTAAQPVSIDPNVAPAAYTQAVRLIFKLYANALAPYTDSNDFPGVWSQNPTVRDKQYTMGLVYGGNPELALRMAAHMTANLIDAYDRERPMGDTTVPSRPYSADQNEPTVVNLQLVASPMFNQTISGVNTSYAYDGGVMLGGGTPNQRGYQSPPTIGPNAIIPIAPSRLAQTTSQLQSNSGGATESGVMTIFGIEAQPFLTEVGTYQIYTDAPHARNGGGDDDHGLDTTPGGGGGGTSLLAPEDNGGKISIRFEPKLDNSDFIGEVIAFQLNNPFDQDVVLYDPAPLPPAAGGAYQIDKVKYYIEFSNRFYSFGQGPDTVATGAPMDFAPGAGKAVLAAGQTRVFYIVNPGTVEEMGKRLQRVDMAHQPADRMDGGTGTTDYTAKVKAWINAQLAKTAAGAQAPILMTQVFPDSLKAVPGKPSTSGGITVHEMDLWGDDASITGSSGEHVLGLADNADRRSVELWRVMRSDATLDPSRAAMPDSTAGDVFNDPTNDLLADRLRDPKPTSGALADLHEAAGANTPINPAGDQTYIDETSGGDGDDGDVQNNTGFTAVIWGAVRRLSDNKLSLTAGGPSVSGGTLDSGGRPIRGVLPPWCMEARSDSNFTTGIYSGSQFTLNSVEKTDKPPSGTFTRTDFEGQVPKGRAKTLKDVWNSTTPVNSQICLPCQQKMKNLIVKNFDRTTTGNGLDYSRVAVEYHSVGEDNLGGSDPTSSTNTSTNVFRSRNPALFSRAGDFLLPLAIGPWFDPSRPASVSPWAASAGSGTGATRFKSRESQWMTLSEALALASGYYNPTDTNDPLHDFGIRTPMTEPPPYRPALVDRGHLVLDAFAPYLTTTTMPATIKQPLGSGAPFALGIIDQFRAALGVSSSVKLTNPADIRSGRPENMLHDFAFGGGSNILTTPQNWGSLLLRTGVPNVNTEPLNVLRTEPLISPVADANAWMSLPAGGSGAPGSPPPYNLADPSLKLFDPSSATALGDYDIAPTIKAYRDRSIEEYRAVGANAPRRVDFSGTNTRTLQLDPFSATTPDTQWRESRGIKSLGELASISPIPAANRATYPRVADLNGMSRFAQTNYAMVTVPTTVTAQIESFYTGFNDSRFYSHTTSGLVDKTGYAQPAGNGQIDPLGGPQLDYSYEDKLTVINALTNTASVRSDIFTIYFLIHGYTSQDVDAADADPNNPQPLVPSIAKRFVMVVDRSNVVAKGDKPRILMLKEVPIP